MAMSAAQHPDLEEYPIDAPATAVAHRADPPVHSDPEIMGGTPVFVGTRVPVEAMFDYLAAGDSLNRFLRHFPSVNREQAVHAIELARESLLEGVGARPR
jgi:uncharacterized protein (DUF433 family)